MKQPNTQRLRALRLSALARDNKVVNAIRSSITQAPDALVKELMDVHGWPAHEALCAVQQLQQDVLDDTTEEVLARSNRSRRSRFGWVIAVPVSSCHRLK